MLSLQYIRDHTEEVRAGVAAKQDSAPIDEILVLDERRRAVIHEAETLKARRNEVSKQIGRMREKPPDLLAEMRAVGDRIKELDRELGELDARLNALLLQVPNVPDPAVPFGKDESENVIVRRWGEPPRFDFEPRPHWEIAERLGILDFARGSKIAGSGFIVYRGLGARLERALFSWFLDLHTRAHGYTEILPPFFANRASMLGTAQLPKFEEDMYRIAEDDLFPVPTAEVPLTNLHRDEILDGGSLPVYYAGYTPCFRREAGAAGKDTRGLLRVHEFDKVELVKLVRPETANDELERLVGDAETALQQLGIPYEVMLMCTGDTGFAQRKKYDLNAWAAGVGKMLEVSSCSNFGDFQARRANIRFRPGPGAKPEFVHTLNGSGVALARTMVCILENYQQADGSVVLPEVLRPYVGVEVIR